MKIFYHTDDDGRCAAAIVNTSLTVVFDRPTEDDFIPYNHVAGIMIPEIKDGETIYIVDLALSTTTFDVIKHCVNKNCKIVHIDHHHTTFKFLEQLDEDGLRIMDKVIKFYKEGISGALLTWVYSCMSDNERAFPNDVAFDFSEKRTHVAFDYNTPDIREYRIPRVVRYIDDNDVWLHDIDETKYFCIAFQLEPEKAPYEEIWNTLIYGSEFLVFQYINDGKMYWKYQEVMNEKNLWNAFEYEIEGHTCLCLNSNYGNSRIFCEKFHEYPMVCKFGYDGQAGVWRYTFYSSEHNHEAVDVSVIASHLGGGGHKHAAGCVLGENIFQNHHL